MPTTATLTADRERGSISVFVILMATTVLVMAGLAVDVSGHVHALQEARSVAREAARVGGQRLEVPTAIRGQGAVADPAAAVVAAHDYLAAAGVTGTATVTGPETVHVSVTTSYSTRFLSIIGIDTLQATGQADSRITRSSEGVEQ